MANQSSMDKSGSLPNVGVFEFDIGIRSGSVSLATNLWLRSLYV